MGQAQVAVITGAAGGIGSEMARSFAAADYNVVLADLMSDSGESLASQIGDNALFFKHDVASESSWQQLTAMIESRYGRLDALINSAAIYHPNVSLENTSLELWRSHFSINCEGSFLGCRYAISMMKKRGTGVIVNISSNLANHVVEGSTSYSATKAAVIAITKSAALSGAHYGIRANVILPGAIETDMLRGNAPSDEQSQRQLMSALVEHHPIGRLGKPQDIAEMALFLCSDKASFITGASFVVDGGSSI